MKITMRIFAFVTVLIMSTVTIPANAEKLQDALDSMFMSNATPPAAFASQTRGGFIGGGAALRAPMRNINLVAFDPPRFSAGCGGIDIFGGSFTFINADQLVALFRQVAANAVGVAFKAAIDAINPQLGKLMSEFQSKLQSLNEQMKNTCAIANSVVKTLSDPDARKEMVNNASTAEHSASGTVLDMFKGFTNLFSNPNGGARQNTVSDKCDACGNPVWRAIVDARAGQYIGNPTTTDSGQQAEYSNELIMSLIGTVILNSTAADKVTPAGTPSVEVGQNWEIPLLTLSQLHDGSRPDARHKRFECQDGHERNQCTIVKTVDLTFEGSVGFVNRMLFGNATGAQNATTADSIVGKLTGCSSNACSFTATQQAFINSTNVQVLAILRQVQQSPGAVEHIARILAPVIAEEYTLSLGKSAVRAAAMAVNGSKVLVPENASKSIDKLHEEIRFFQQRVSDQLPRVMKAKEYAKVIVANNPSIFSKPGRR
ncbi:conjugal transfer protein TraH [Noviherbaspirillum sp. CPCC 100848]|uniref:Conjugal transfer protein TraH n=1 Tax=Noviherbaspirillum album TaxID=3080276 RepID=A0ABU6JA03_9BURK|nr:conjugal transfer protein TraH [Noviherbaspirillum sp. CPCC 100848]MEC4720484.1 conjugal transfer protein TraH [Noviherbaspirillum sp. CPCC 100848]